MYYEETPECVSRWRITGRIRTESPLHVGDGSTDRIETRACNKAFLDGADPLYSKVMTTRSQNPVIPGTSLKGALHAWASEHLWEGTLVLETFGSPERGGIVTFHDAILASVPQPENPDARMWSQARSTSLTPQVVINPRSRAAEESLLYYVEYVPAGAEFEVSFTAQGGTSRHRALLLHVIQSAFQSAIRPARLGSESANGWGRVTWVPGSYERMDLTKWLAGPLKPWRECLDPVDSATQTRWVAASAAFTARPAPATVTLNLILDFDGAMLVNDPSRRRKAGDGGHGSSGEPVGHAMIRTDSGAVYLPSQSVRGAFRAQARRIWHTVFHNHPSENLNLVSRDFKEVRHEDGQKRLAAFLKLFGAAGWRTPIEIGDFKLEAGGTDYPQEFVAVDRFTGGVAGSKKFTARGIWKPRFSGTIRIRTDRLFSRAEHKAGEDPSAEAGPWVWLIIAWTLRDWAEGDGSIGFGRSKGYGAFRASITAATGGPEAALLQRVIQRDKSALESAEVAAWEGSLSHLLTRGEAA